MALALTLACLALVVGSIMVVLIVGDIEWPAGTVAAVCVVVLTGDAVWHINRMLSKENSFG